MRGETNHGSRVKTLKMAFVNRRRVSDTVLHVFLLLFLVELFTEGGPTAVVLTLDAGTDHGTNKRVYCVAIYPGRLRSRDGNPCYFHHLEYYRVFLISSLLPFFLFPLCFILFPPPPYILLRVALSVQELSVPCQHVRFSCCNIGDALASFLLF